jgi:hypothetical protein
VPWYLSGNPFVYNPELFAKAGVDPNTVKTWEDLARGKLKAAGIVPISGGLKDGWFGGWLFSITGRQGADSEKDFMEAALTPGAYLEPKFSDWWGKLVELKEAGCWNEDINSVNYQDGQDLFVQGKSAMIFGNDTFLAGWAKDLGWDKMGVMMAPKYGTGKLADTYVTTAQGWGITAWSKYPKESADFLQFMHTPERVNAWFEATGVLPADNRMDTNLIQQEQLKQIYEWDTKIAGPNLENFIPPLWTSKRTRMHTAAVRGEKTPQQCAELTEEVLAKWRAEPGAGEELRGLDEITCIPQAQRSHLSALRLVARGQRLSIASGNRGLPGADGRDAGASLRLSAGQALCDERSAHRRRGHAVRRPGQLPRHVPGPCVSPGSAQQSHSAALCPDHGLRRATARRVLVRTDARLAALPDHPVFAVPSANHRGRLDLAYIFQLSGSLTTF